MHKKSLKNQKIDRRSSPRKRLEAMVKVTREEEQTTESTMNYSLTGLFLKSNFRQVMYNGYLFIENNVLEMFYRSYIIDWKIY